MSYNNTYTTISAKIHRAIKRQVNELCRETDKSESRIVKEALSIYLDTYEGLDVHPSIKDIINKDKLFMDVYAEDYYIKKQNERVSLRLKELTFIEFMEKNMAIVYMANKRHMDNDSLIEMLRSSLKAMEDRAEHHDFEEEWQNRYENPIEYTEEFLDAKSLEEKAFNDYMDSL